MTTSLKISDAGAGRSIVSYNIDSVAFAVYLLGAFLLWLSAPHHGEFWWSDSPRHALNGVFVKDLIKAMPWQDPVGFASQYYLQYPALTILFYPPLFYVLSAPFFAIFGVSHGVALAVVMLHYMALAFGLYLLARRWLSPGVALACGLSIMVAPGIALWGRQVMLEVPCLAFSVWASLLLCRYADSGRHRLLYLGSFLLLCAIYTKISAVFLAPVMAVMLYAANGNSLWRDRQNWIAAGLFLLGLLPIGYLTVKFGSANVQSVVGISDAEVSRGTLAGWLWYARQLPDQLGWPLLVAALLCPVLVVLGRRPAIGRADAVMLVAWFAIGYLFFSLIDLKEARHSTLILPPLLVAAGLTAEVLLPTRLAGVTAMLLVLGTGFYTWRWVPVPEVSGYREAAEWIATEAPADAVIAFSGKRDGSFIFNMRSIEARRDIYTLRADKLLLSVAVRRELGVKQQPLSEQEIGKMLDQDGVRYVVAQSDFWTDLAVMARLQALLRSDHFAEVARIPVRANVPTEDRELRIYMNRHEVESAARKFKLNLPIINRTIEGETSGP